MKVMLIQPDFRSTVGGFRLAAIPEPLALEMNAAVLDADRHEVDLLDMRLDGDLEGRLAAFAPDLVAVTALPGTQLYREQFDRLLTRDYRCFDALHAVVPTRMGREAFYQQFAGLYRQRNIWPYMKLVQEGKLEVDDCRRGKRLRDAMSDRRSYLDQDPVLGGLERRA